MRITRKRLNSIITEEIMNVIKEADLDPIIGAIEDNPEGGLAGPGWDAAGVAVVEAQIAAIDAQIENLSMDEDVPIDEETRMQILKILKLTREELANLRDNLDPSNPTPRAR
jgi:hypothetical protein